MSRLRFWSQLSVVLWILYTPLGVVGEERKQAAREFGDLFNFAGKHHVVIPDLHYDGSHPITFETIVATLYRGSIVGDFNGAGIGLGVANGYCAFHVNDGRATDNGYANVKSRTSVGRNKLVHIAGVFDGKEMRLYVGGKLEGSEPIGEFNKSPHPFMVGADPGGHSEPTKFLIGKIDSLRVSKDARYRKDFTPPNKFESDEHTLVLYRFTERDGNFVADKSGHERHGKIVGEPK